MASSNKFLKPVGVGNDVRDFKHASRTFVDNNFELSPRHAHLFHVVFSFTPEAATLFDTVSQLEIPILVKSIDLPQYVIDVQTHNQYNRKVQSHHGMQYQPVNATFHDDTKDLIRQMWHKYYIFYNADATYDANGNSYTAYDKYSDRVQQQWGFQRGNKRFFKDIKIYSMHQHKFAEYTLINPIITAFGHDTHAYASNGVMQHTVQFAYETVKYATGYVNDITPRGFADIHYDLETSDIAPTDNANKAMINGNLQSVAGQGTRDLFQGNLIGTIQDADIIFDQTKPFVGTGSVLTDSLSILANNLLTGQKPTSNILVPIIGTGEGILNQVADTAFETVTEYISPPVSDSAIKSQGQNISTNRYNTKTNNSVDLGNGKVYPAEGTVAKPTNMSKNVRISNNVQAYATKSQKEIELSNRLNDPTVPNSEKAQIRDRLDNMRR